PGHHVARACDPHREAIVLALNLADRQDVEQLGVQRSAVELEHQVADIRSQDIGVHDMARPRQVRSSEFGVRPGSVRSSNSELRTPNSELPILCPSRIITAAGAITILPAPKSARWSKRASPLGQCTR